jgi:glycosyltransferase involved in cell wall biosynthesis
MKILHVTVWPGPPFSGLNIYPYNFLKRLTPRHASRMIAVAGEDFPDEMSVESLHRLGIIVEHLDVIRHRQVRHGDRISGLLFGHGVPYVAFWEKVVGPRVRAAAHRAIREWQPEVLMVWGAAFATICAEIPGVRKVLHACDSLSLANENAAQQARTTLRGFYYRLVARRCRELERVVFSRFERLIFVSKRDADHVDLPATLPVTVIPNGVDTSMVVPRILQLFRPERPVIVFHGNLAYSPNADALNFLVGVVGRRLESEFGTDGFEMRIFGAGASARQKSWASKKRWLRIEGYVEDIYKALSEGDLYIAPLVSGAGMKNKILDAMNCGLPILGTEEAFSGLDVRSGINCVICPIDAVADAAVKLLAESESLNRYGEAARAWVSKNADWELQAQRLEEVLTQS